MSDDDDNEPPPIGTVIAGRYRLEEIVGQGGMGVVYRARHEQLDKGVAVKIMLPVWAAEKQFRLRFEREARICAQLHHPNIVAVHDFGGDGGMPYLVMDLLAGHSLRNELDELRTLAIDRSLRIVADVAAALAAAHAQGLVHRDMKPANIMLEPSASTDASGGAGERPMIIDFGLAAVRRDAGADLTGGTKLTEVGTVMGTPEYIAPEQAQGLEVRSPGDIYSLGCVLMECLTGDPPFLGSVSAVLLTQHMFMPAPPARSRRPEIPAAIDELIAEMLVKVPEERPDATEVRERILDVLTGDGKRPRARPPRTRKSRMLEVPDPSTGTPTHPMPVGGEIPGVITTQSMIVAVVGWKVPDDVRAAGASNDLHFVEDAAVAASAGASGRIDVIYAPAASAAQLPALIARAPVVVAADPVQFSQSMDLLKAGAADIIALPANPSDLVRKLVRVAKQARRRAKGA